MTIVGYFWISRKGMTWTKICIFTEKLCDVSCTKYAPFSGVLCVFVKFFQVYDGLDTGVQD
jgi:hypothetical protein